MRAHPEAYDEEWNYAKRGGWIHNTRQPEVLQRQPNRHFRYKDSSALKVNYQDKRALTVTVTVTATPQLVCGSTQHTLYKAIEPLGLSLID